MYDGSLFRWISEQMLDIFKVNEKEAVEYVLHLAQGSHSARDLEHSICSKMTDTCLERSTISSFSDSLFSRLHGPLNGKDDKSSKIESRCESKIGHSETMIDELDMYEMRLRYGRRPLDQPGILNSPKIGREFCKTKKTKYCYLDPSSKGNNEISSQPLPEENSEQNSYSEKGSKDAEVGEHGVSSDIAVTEADGGSSNSNVGPSTSTLDEDDLEARRTESRRIYLSSRTIKKITENERLLEAERKLFDWNELTEAEKKLRRLDEDVLSFTKKQAQAIEQYTNMFEDIGYRVPVHQLLTEDGKLDLKKREEYFKSESRLQTDSSRSRKVAWENPRNDYLKSDGQQWEENQLQKAAVSSRNENRQAQNSKYPSFLETPCFFKMDYLPELQLPEEAQAMLKNKPYIPANAHEDLDSVRKSLPIYHYASSLVEAVKNYQILIMVGETGSGKTTQLAQYLHDEGFAEKGRIGCTQPRRVAAITVADRVAREMSVRLGEEVGYSIRFEDLTSEKTKIKYMTDGMLLREFLNEPDLSSYSVIIIDEAHERTLNTDILFGLLKDITRFRPELKLVISSATLDASKFSSFFDNAPLFKIPGRRFPVDICYATAPEADYIETAVSTVLQTHVTQALGGREAIADSDKKYNSREHPMNSLLNSRPSKNRIPGGDILVFLTGQDEIESACVLLEERLQSLPPTTPELIICKIYAALPAEQQTRIFETTPQNARKVIFATNIAETSVTIDGISYVIDSGFCKQNVYQARNGMQSLQVTPISRASAEQRAGRAGRTGPGICFRLYTKYTYDNDLQDSFIPEIQRTNMCNAVLVLKSMGIHDLIHFDFMDRPSVESLMRALEQLYALGALNDNGELTKLGRRMADLPLEPMLSKMILKSQEYACTSEILTLCSMLSVGSSDLFYRPHGESANASAAHRAFRHVTGDHLTLIEVYNQWAASGFSPQWCFENFVQYKYLKRARNIREQLTGLADRVELDAEVSNDDSELLLKCVLSGHFYNVAQLGKDGNYISWKTKQCLRVHPSSCLFHSEKMPEWIVYQEMLLTSQEYARTVSEITPQWLLEIAPHYFPKLNDTLANTCKQRFRDRGSKPRPFCK